eukprot:CAMPEP_0202454696 /NCGR_PEP_ID=MMETSP1360-20130828/12360_1 /ASSEMBLY_ACC=CAM_ASM_000848 /TAXON_ID=515479 /ORGANISM="Licmophora paradoxa, Strain CCMP2313" /LENGTH=961 /DNA_ID=CAMNT_0049074079 /DNA_START=49 /DNA_END=2934 /DNA_ORIENTATION=-
MKQQQQEYEYEYEYEQDSFDLSSSESTKMVMNTMKQQPKSQQVLLHEGLPLLSRRLKGSIGPGGRLEEIKEQSYCERMSRSFLWFSALILVAIFFYLHPFAERRWSSSSTNNNGNLQKTTQWELICENGKPCYEKEFIRVPEGKFNFPSFWNYASHGPIRVSYDQRAITLNGTRSLFLGGSAHPIRATPETWSHALDEAVLHGLNLITVYVFWGAHQPFPDQPFDWNLPGNCAATETTTQNNENDNSNNDNDYSTKHHRSTCDWNLASAIRAAANRGLFVHARIGPYACAEYNYGGIPEWLALNNPNMSMRRPNQPWMDAMEEYVKQTTSYFTRNKLWAHQGGPVILGQIENELGDDIDYQTENIITVPSEDGLGERLATMQDYADWSGEIAAKYEPKVVWTMCNGLTAKNTINTCNGYGGNSCSTEYLESNGQNGRIQVDQPAMWTEDEQGFQVWDEEASHPIDYFWGTTARSLAREALQWFARGGSHLNYYMWWGGYNRGRSAAGGIMNMYANDATMCSSGQRRQPKFSHLQQLHETIIDLAPFLMESPSALGKNQSVEIMSDAGTWVKGTEQRIFIYTALQKSDDNAFLPRKRDYSFIENDSRDVVVVRYKLLSLNGFRTIQMQPSSSVVLIDGMLAYDSGTINPRMKKYRRNTVDDAVALKDWGSWEEPTIDLDKNDPLLRVDSKPIEQTDLMINAKVSSDYAWYQTNIRINEAISGGTMLIETVKASGMSLFIDGLYVGSSDDHTHGEGNVTLAIPVDYLGTGVHTISILSENFGYFNLIGRWGASAKAKIKGIIGSVTFSGQCVHSGPCSKSLVDGREWFSFPGLRGENNEYLEFLPVRAGVPTSWSKAYFDTPTFEAASDAFFLDMTSGRGHVWLNGNDLGRFWNITRGKTNVYSQRYYLLPREYFYFDGSLNELVIFNSLGSNHESTKIVLSGIEMDEESVMEDEVDFPSACI